MGSVTIYQFTEISKAMEVKRNILQLKLSLYTSGVGYCFLLKLEYYSSEKNTQVHI